MTHVSRLVQRHPWLVIALFAAVTLAAALHAPYITMTTDIKEFFPANDPRVATYDEISEYFGGGDYVMVAVESDTVFDPAVLESLDGLTRSLERVPGALDVTSLANATEVRDSPWGIELAPLMSEVPTSTDELDTLRAAVMGDPMYKGTLVSEDERSALVVLQVDPEADSDAVVTAVEDAAASYAGPGTVRITGVPVLNKVLVESMQSDLRTLVPLVLMVVAAVLFASFRCLSGVVLPFVTVFMSLVWTLGLMSWLGISLSPLSSVLPVILISLGNAYGIYILRRYREECCTDPPVGGSPLSRTMASVGIAVVLAGTTTIAGFSANMTSEITMMREFGLFTAFGVAVALVVSVLFVPALLALLPREAAAKDAERSDRYKDVTSGAERGFLSSMARGVLRRPHLALWGSAAVLLYALLAIPSIQTDSNFFNFFDEDSAPREAYDFVREAFGGSETIEVLVEGDVPSPQVLAGMAAVQEDFIANPRTAHPASVVDILTRVDAALDEDKSEGDIPASRQLAAQYLLLVEMDENNVLDRFTTIDYSRARLQARASDTSAEGLRSLIAEAEASVERHLGSVSDRATLTGVVVLMDALAEMLVRGQILSLVASLLAVFLIVRMLLRSWEGSALCVTSIVLVTIALFAIMASTGIPLDIVTVLISSVAVGVGIDYSIHVYTRYQQELRQGREWEAALQQAMTSTGKAIITNAGAVIAGFSILSLSSFPPLRYFGILVSATMFLAAASALTFLPSAIAWRQRRRAVACRQRGL